MRRLFALILIGILAFAIPAAALDLEQRSFYGVGELVLPMGDFGDFAGTGFGGRVGVTVPHSDQLNLRAEIGYLMFGGKDFGHYDFSYSMIPIMFLGEYHHELDSPMYFLGGLGFTRFAFDAEYTGDDGDFFSDYDDSSMELTLCFGGGYSVNEQFIIEGRFNVISDANSIRLLGVYHF